MKAKKLSVDRDHVLDALTGYMQALSMIDDDHEVTDLRRVGNNFELKIEETTYEAN